MTDLPPEVAGTTTRYLELIDKALPGRVTGFYLTGSVPLGDYRPGRSDIDGVAVVSSVVSAALVREVHEQLPSAPAFDVTYVTAADLAAAPDRGKPVVFTQDGVLKEVPSDGPVSPVLWSELARQSIAVRTAPGLLVHDDQEALEAFTRDNLTSYWAPQFDQLESGADGKPDDEVVPDWVLPWFMLGVPRLHALLATGNIISKTGAGEHALVAFPEWAPLLNRCLDHRAGKPDTFTYADARTAVPFGRKVITEALAL